MLTSTNLLAGFSASYVPRFENHEEDPYFLDYLSKQASFWGAVRSEIAKNPALKAFVEIRYSSNPDTQRQSVVLLCWTELVQVSVEHEQLIRLIENLLPDDFGWQALDAHELSTICNDNREWYVSRLERRVDFVDLGEGPIDLAEQVDRYPGESLGDETDDILGYRKLPSSATNRESLQTESYCVPDMPELVFDSRSMRRVLTQMQRLSPSIISIIIAPIDPSFLRAVKSQALFWRRFHNFNSLSDGEAQSDSNNFEADGGVSALDRFQSTDAQLSHVTLRAAGLTKVNSISIAQQLASLFGGVSVFDVLPPTDWVSLNLISDPWSDVPSLRWDDADWERARAVMEVKLQQEWIEPLEFQLPTPIRLIKTLPFIFTCEEADKILNLPFADSDGLPGLSSAPVPPFSGSVPQACPVVDRLNGCVLEPPDSALRLGIIRQGSAHRSDNNSDKSVHGVDVVAKYSDAHWHTMEKVNLTKHAFIVGSTGSGKTMVTLFLVRELARLGTPFMVIEPVKTEYMDNLSPFSKQFEKSPGGKVQRLRFEGNEDGDRAESFLPFDPMRIPYGVTVARHASNLKACFEAAFPLEAVQALLLESGIRSYYTAPRSRGGCGYKLFTLARPGMEIRRDLTVEVESKGHNPARLNPSLRGFEKYFLVKFLPKAFGSGSKNQSRSAAEIRESFVQLFKRRLEALWDGMIGESARHAEQMYFEDPSTYESLRPYLKSNTIVELDGIPDGDQKALMMAFLLTYLFERRQADDFAKRNPKLALGLDQDGPPIADKLKHVLIIEEAHRLLAPPGSGGRGDLAGMSSKAKAVSLFVDMLAEIRALGQSLVLVEQIPTKIIPEAVKNTNLKVMLRVTAKDDRDYLGEAMSFTEEQKQFVTSLRARGGHGIDMVIFEEGVDQPLMLNLPLPETHDESQPWLYNEFFTQE